MAKVLILVPAMDSDPSEVAVSWRVLTRAGHEVVVASPDGEQTHCDELMVTGTGPLAWRGSHLGRAVRGDAL